MYIKTLPKDNTIKFSSKI